ncbi:hypothetical protein KCU92_g2059, partial [Aureobasidium melanogenum]|jgi:hypothetical protein
MEQIRFLMRKVLRTPSLWPARYNIWNGQELVCKKGDNPLLWMLTNNTKEFEMDMGYVRTFFAQHARWGTLFGEPSLAARQAEFKIDLKERYSVVPYDARREMLNRLISATITDMKGSKNKRTLQAEQASQTPIYRKSKKALKLENVPHEWGIAQPELEDELEDEDDDDDEVQPTPSKKRKITTNAQTLKGALLKITDAGGMEDFIQISALSDNTVPTIVPISRVLQLKIENVY